MTLKHSIDIGVYKSFKAKIQIEQFTQTGSRFLTMDGKGWAFA